jgi:hypothetical protein
LGSAIKDVFTWKTVYLVSFGRMIIL